MGLKITHSVRGAPCAVAAGAQLPSTEGCDAPNDTAHHAPRTVGARWGGAVRFKGLSVGAAGSRFEARGAVAQLGERLDRTQEVRGSSPLSSTWHVAGHTSHVALGARGCFFVQR